MRRSCRLCWDPVDKDGADLCDWCLMTPRQRRSMTMRHSLTAVAILSLFAVFMIYLELS